MLKRTALYTVWLFFFWNSLKFVIAGPYTVIIRAALEVPDPKPWFAADFVESLILLYPTFAVIAYRKITASWV